MLELKDVNINNGDKPIASHLSFYVGEGEIMEIAGRAECGKSSILKCIMGMMPTMGGYITLEGEVLTPRSTEYFRKLMGYLPQDYGVSGMHVSELFDTLMNLEVNRHRQATKQSLYREWNMLGIDHSLFAAEIESIDSATLQRVMLSLVACVERKVLLLDEPTSRQDEHGRQLIEDYLRDKAELGTALLMTRQADCDLTISYKG